MPIQNQAGLYSGGQGIFNSTPFTQFVLKQDAIKKAKDDAIDKYYNNLPNTINEQGVRDQEIPLIHDKKDEIQQYYQQNRDAIKKGNTPEAFNLGKKFREAQGIIQESKNRAATATKLSQLRGNPKYNYLFEEPDAIHSIMNHELPVGKEGSQAINYDQFTIPPEPLDEGKYAKTRLNTLSHTDNIQDAPNPADKLTLIRTNKPMLNDEGKQQLKDIAVHDYNFDPKVKRQVDKYLQDPQHLIGLNAMHQQVFGKPLPFDKDGNIDKEAATAAYLSTIVPEKEVKQTIVPNKSAIMDRQEALRKLLQANSFAEREKLQKNGYSLRHFYKTQDDEQLIKDVDGVVQQQVDEANSEPEPPIGTRGKPLKVTTLVLNAFKQKDPNTGKEYTPTGINVLNSGNFLIKGAASDGGDLEITRPEYRATLVKGVYPTKSEQAQIHTDKTIGTGKTSSSQSSSTSTKTNQPAIVEQNGHKFKLNSKTGKYEYYQ